MKGILALEDGTVFTGKAFGATGMKTGEVVFYTGLAGYQRLLTHPNSQNKILIMTHPLVGNCGLMEDEMPVSGSHLSGLVVREVCYEPYHRTATISLPGYLKEQNIIGLCGIDTRALTRHLRDYGVMGGILSTEGDASALLGKVSDMELPSTKSLAKDVSATEPEILPGELERIAVVDFGGGRDIAADLNRKNHEVVLLPFNTTVEAVQEFNPRGLVLSDGAGDPRELARLIASMKGLTRVGVSFFGIGMGCQLLALALDAKVDKMKLGHRGDNYPVRDLRTGRVYITFQNHGFVVNKDSLEGTGLQLTHLNVNDRTVEGFCHGELPLFGMQFSTGSFSADGEADYLLDKFLLSISGGRL